MMRNLLARLTNTHQLSRSFFFLIAGVLLFSGVHFACYDSPDDDTDASTPKQDVIVIEDGRIDTLGEDGAPIQDQFVDVISSGAF